tara:strand:+ start:28 stop:207 length:180 start_codon:yes stop_codon:yes gene_type:complete
MEAIFIFLVTVFLSIGVLEEVVVPTANKVVDIAAPVVEKAGDLVAPVIDKVVDFVKPEE